MKCLLLANERWQHLCAIFRGVGAWAARSHGRAEVDDRWAGSPMVDLGAAVPTEEAQGTALRAVAMIGKEQRRESALHESALYRAPSVPSAWSVRGCAHGSPSAGVRSAGEATPIRPGSQELGVSTQPRLGDFRDAHFLNRSCRATCMTGGCDRCPQGYISGLLPVRFVIGTFDETPVPHESAAATFGVGRGSHCPDIAGAIRGPKGTAVECGRHAAKNTSRERGLKHLRTQDN